MEYIIIFLIFIIILLIGGFFLYYSISNKLINIPSSNSLNNQITTIKPTTSNLQIPINYQITNNPKTTGNPQISINYQTTNNPQTLDNTSLDCIYDLNIWSTCDSNTGLKKRPIIKNAINGGKCEIPVTECPVNCVYDTNKWEECDLSSGIKKRPIITPSKNNGSCNLPITECPVNCTYSDNTWTSCNIYTGFKTKTILYNQKNGGATCPPAPTMPCNCVGTWDNVPNAVCSKECDSGVIEQKYTSTSLNEACNNITVPNKQVPCNTRPCNKVSFYTGENFTGEMISLGPGTYNLDNYTGYKRNIKSIYIPSNVSFKVTIYESETEDSFKYAYYFKSSLPITRRIWLINDGSQSFPSGYGNWSDKITNIKIENI